jgi:hypothetical protein
MEGVSLAEDASADIQLNIFNQFAYFSWPGHDFQPLAIQLELDDQEQLAIDLRSQLNSIRKWNHFFTLENPANDFDKCPIRVTLKTEGAEPVDITNGEFRLTARKERDEFDCFYQHSEITIENLTKKTLYVGVVALGSDIGISSLPFEEMVVELGPGKTKQFYDHTDGISKISLDRYKEIYNWKEEWFHYKFIYNNFEDFSTTLQDDFLQDPLPNPLLLETRRSKTRGEGGSSKKVREKWGTCLVRMELSNPNYNKLTEALQGEAEGYANSEELSPFIKELYFDQEPVLGNMTLTLKQNQQDSAVAATSKATDSWIVKLFNRIYKRKRRREFLRYQQTGGPIVIAEGDSWFLFPKPGVRDTLDYIMEKFHLLALAEAGDEVSDYLKNDELLVEVEKYKPAYALISGGGNDILGEEVKSILRDRVQGALSSTDHLDLDAFNNKMAVLKKGYIHFIEGVQQRSPGTRVLIHGYDYVRSNPDARTIKKGWANRYMIDYGINDHAIRKEIITYLVDTFNDMLKALAGSYDYVTYIDNRGTVHEDQWLDEIHPNNMGFEKVAANFLAKM